MKNKLLSILPFFSFIHLENVYGVLKMAGTLLNAQIDIWEEDWDTNLND